MTCWLLLFGWLAAPEPRQPDPVLLQRFRTEAPQQWRVYSTYSEKLQGALSNKVKRGETMKMNAEIRIRENGECFSCMQTNLLTAEINCFVINHDYYFSLNSKANLLNWKVTSVDRSPPSSSSRELSEKTGTYSVKRSALCINGQYLPDMFNSPVCRIREIKQLPGDNSHIEVAFANENSADASRLGPIQSGLVVFDARHYWAIVSGNVNVVASNVMSGTIKTHRTYKHVDDMYPIPTLISDTFDMILVGAPSKPLEAQHLLQTVEHAFDLSVPEVLPAQEAFTMTAFGLPEPPWSLRAPGDSSIKLPWFVIVTVLGIVCLIFAVFLTLCQKKTNRKEGSI